VVVSGLSFDRAGNLYAVYNNVGVSRRPPDGSWTQIGPSLPPQSSLYALAVDPGSVGTIYVGYVTSGGIPSAGVLKTTDGGLTWSPASSGLTISPITTLVIDPTNPAHLYAGSSNDSEYHLGEGPAGVFRSLDGGASWHPLGSSPTYSAGTFIYAIAIDPSDPLTLYASSYGTIADMQRQAEILKSSDGGDTWLPLTGLYNPGEVVVSIAIDPKNSATVYAATNRKVFVSSDAGATWTSYHENLGPGAAEFPTSPQVLALDPVDPSILFLGTAGAQPSGPPGDFFLSPNAAQTWHSWRRGLPEGPVTFSVYALTVNPADGRQLYAGTSSGVFTVEVPAIRPETTTLLPRALKAATQLQSQ
jgi:photosystem II stability/assembly factor-like uncharacterized protein